MKVPVDAMQVAVNTVTPMKVARVESVYVGEGRGWFGLRVAITMERMMGREEIRVKTAWYGSIAA